MTKSVVLVVALVSASFSSLGAFAATPACKRMVADRALSTVERRVNDDCFLNYTQEARNDADTVYVSVTCDHTGEYKYIVRTAPQGKTCRIVSVRARN